MIVQRWLVLCLAALSCQSSGADSAGPTLDLLQKRAAPWKHMSVEQVATSPTTFLVNGLLTQQEIADLLALQRRGSAAGLEQLSPDGTHGFVDLESAPLELRVTAVTQVLNSRLSALVGMPEDHIEDGYFGLKGSGFQFGNVHLDNFRPNFKPHRLASFVIYVTDDFSGGHTVLPLALANESGTKDMADEWDESLIENGQWDARTCSSAGNGAVLPDSASFIVCSRLLRKSWCRMAFGFHDLCRPLLTKSAFKCIDPTRPTAVRPEAGGAVLFYDLSADGELTSRAMHGSCGVEGGKKIVFAKFVRAGPGPWKDDAIPSTNPLEKLAKIVWVLIGTILFVHTLKILRSS